MYSPESASQPKAGPRFQPIKKRDRKKQWVTGSHAISALERKFQETLGQIKQLDEAEYEWDKRSGFDLAEKYEAELRARLRAALVSLENAIRLICPDWNRKHLMKPKATRQTRPMFPRGQFQNAVITCLRRAVAPLTVYEIVEIVAPKLGLPNPTADQRRRMRIMARSSLRGYYDKGFVDCVGEPAKWFARDSQADAGIDAR
jgi:hypothetical protein